MNDAEVHDWLDRLLNLRADECAAVLQQLAQDDPWLHARLVRLLDAARAAAGTVAIEHPFIQGVTAG